MKKKIKEGTQVKFNWRFFPWGKYEKGEGRLISYDGGYCKINATKPEKAFYLVPLEDVMKVK